ncbi:hypothetical protein ACWGJT_34015 [Streptomyces xantholiticus]
MSPRRQGRTADNGGANPVAVPLPDDDDGVVVGDQVGRATRTANGVKRKRPPFGSYMDSDLQKRFKAHCVLAGIEMQDGLEQAVTQWLAREQAH